MQTPPSEHDQPMRCVVTTLADGSVLRLSFGEFLRWQARESHMLRNAAINATIKSAWQRLRRLASFVRGPAARPRSPRHFTLSFLALALLGAFCAPTLAGQAAGGPIPIDQAKALAGGVTAGDAAGFPVTITQPGSYRLMSDLVVDQNHGIEITVDNVTIDLNGFHIVGPLVCTTPYASMTCTGGPATASGIVAIGRDAIQVSNGAIRGFAYGLRVGNHGRATHLNVSHALVYGIMVASGSQVTDNVIRMVGGDGIMADGLVGNNTVRQIRNTGIIANNYSLVSGNRVSEVGSHAIFGTAALIHNSFAYYGGTPYYNSNLIGPNACNGQLCQ